MTALLEFNASLDWWLLLAVPGIPLVGYIVQIFLRDKLPQGDKILTAGMFVVMCITMYMAFKAISAGYASGGHETAAVGDHATDETSSGTAAGESHAAEDHGEEAAADHAEDSGEHHVADFFHNSAAPDTAEEAVAGSTRGPIFRWLYSRGGEADGNIVAGLLYDPLGAIMLAVVGIVSFCVHLFSIGYMHGDKRYLIFFANISLFTFAMLGLVLADNILFLFIFWEIMGLMSYLLIGHFAHDQSNSFFHAWATWASKKAFMTTRVGDVCLLIGMVMFYNHFETLQFTELWARAREAVDANGGEFPAWMTTAGLFTFGGTVGKSAQFPLHIWLPDAMAGPTPVSAMIHAATMVAAGVFLLGRMYPLMSPEVLSVITVVGATTAIFAATIGLVVYDLKAVLAYSTISQLGFMVAAVGMGGLVAGMFHMVTHAFFKACLFLSAGSVIHGCHHVQDMRLMGGLRKKMPITFACMLVCTLAIAGVPFFAGFYSKDMIILAGWANLGDVGHFSGWDLYALLTLAIAAALTAFYMFRLIFMTFFGEYRGNSESHMYSAQIAAEGVEGPAPHDDHDEHAESHHDDHGHDAHGHDDHGSHAHEPHESPFSMVFALCILAFFGLLGGHFWLADPGHLLHFWHSEPWFTKLVSVESLYPGAVGSWVASSITEGITDHNSHIAHVAHTRAVILSLFVASLGIFGAYFLYHRRRDLPAKIVATFPLAHTLLRKKYFVDEAVDRLVLRPCMSLSRWQTWIDNNVVDGFVLFVGRLNKALGFFSAWFDRVFVDGAVNGVGMVSQGFGYAIRLLQTGRIQQYATFAVAGGLLTAAWLILS